jgi:fluoride ion exporter CrcB/FEX
VLAVVGVCSGLSTYSSLALELATAVRARDRRGLVMSLAGTALGLAAGLGSAAVVSAVTSR